MHDILSCPMIYFFVLTHIIQPTKVKNKYIFYLAEHFRNTASEFKIKPTGRQFTNS